MKINEANIIEFIQYQSIDEAFASLSQFMSMDMARDILMRLLKEKKIVKGQYNNTVECGPNAPAMGT